MSHGAGPDRSLPYIADETLVLLSFPMMNHGGMFAHWLRDQLMKAYNLFSTNAVYCDCVASRHVGTVLHQSRRPVAGPDDRFPAPAWTDDQNRAYEAGASRVALDTREHLRNQGYAPIGAANKAWDENFRTAMLQARAMVFVWTADYASSPWCMQEWLQFHEENTRPARRGAPLKGVVLQFDGAGLGGHDTRNMTVLAVQRATGLGGLLWQDQGSPRGYSGTPGGQGRSHLTQSWGLSKPDLRKLVAAIGPVR